MHLSGAAARRYSLARGVAQRNPWNQNARKSYPPEPWKEEVRALLASGAGGAVAIVGSPGSGKTTALEHLAAVLPPDARIKLMDSPSQAEVVAAQDSALVAFAATAADGLGDLVAKYQLAPWTRDDVIEYLLHAHHDRCGSVIDRLREEERALLGGLPELCRIVCDELARDAAVTKASVALRRYIANSAQSESQAQAAKRACLMATAYGSTTALMDTELPEALLRVVRHRRVQYLLAAECIAADLRGSPHLKYLERRLPRELVREVASEIGSDLGAIDNLRKLFASSRRSQAMVASILHASGNLPNQAGRKAILRGAYLEGLDWPNAKLAKADLRDADLSRANLENADFTKASLNRAIVTYASLNGAVLTLASIRNANLSGAQLQAIRAERACFDQSNLEFAQFQGADLHGASFKDANLSGASFHDANLTRALLASAKVAETDFSLAKLDGARLDGLQLRDTELRGASFREARLRKCDLEGVALPDAHFERADLTGAWLSASSMRRANFSHANLCRTGLAEIDWEGASLRGVDLRGATFHMGGTRSGLVYSPIASEGSRTGFYTDEFEEQHFKSPEEIRKANLCGVDLRGARIDGVDFYLVDLRDARFDPAHEPLLRRCGAILEARAC